MMLRSRHCALRNFTDEQLYLVEECPLDPGGYFIINGTEKVLLAQEKMAGNTVYVFEKKDSKTLFIGEIKSITEHTNRPVR